MPPNAREIVVERTGLRRVWRRADVPLDTVLAAAAAEGETLKQNAKSHTKRVGAFVVKTSEGPLPVQLVKHTCRRTRYRRGWDAALFLERHNVPAPRPVAHIEWCIAGLIWRHATVTEFIPDCQDVEHFYDAQARAGASQRELSEYLARLATAVNALAASGAHHTDLAGKNVLTRDGDNFHFIDLDAIELAASPNETRQLQLHVQLYDSFVDRCDAATLEAFLNALCKGGVRGHDAWLARVKTAQQARRARTLAAWKREGKR